jgi:hypothetical protein
MQAILIGTTFQIGHHGCTLVDRQLDALAEAAGITIAAKLPLWSDWSQLAPSDFDLVIVNGEGGLHHNSKAAKQIGQVPRWAHTRNKPAFLINTVYEANSADIAADIADYDAVFVRDDFSRGALAEAGVDSATVPDLTLSWAPSEKGGHGRSIVVTDSTLRDTNESLHAFATALGARYLPLMGRPPCPYFKGMADGGRWQRYVVKRMASLVAPPGLWRGRWRGLIPDFQDFIDWLRQNAGLVISGRFHGVCLAIDLEIPVLAVPSNTWKIEGVLKIAGLENRLITDLGVLRHRLETEGIEPFGYSSMEIERMRSLRRKFATDSLDMFKFVKERAAAYETLPLVGSAA